MFSIAVCTQNVTFEARKKEPRERNREKEREKNGRQLEGADFAIAKNKWF